MFDHPLLAALAAVIREGSFERAALALNVTPSAVSQRVKLLEERSGCVLVVRGQPCTPTETGRLLCRHAEQVGMLQADLLRALPQLAGGAGADGAGQGAERVSLRLAVNADSLAAWLVPALASFAEHEPALLDLSLDDQDHTADRLRSGDVIAAITAQSEPIQGCRSIALGSLRYIATASPAFIARYFADGITAKSLRRAPCLVFDRKDRLQAQWIERVVGGLDAADQSVTTPRHWLPSSQAFVDASVAGLGWGMNPVSMVRSQLTRGTLLELKPHTHLDVPLYWQHTRTRLPMLDRLTDAICHAARDALEAPAPAPTPMQPQDTKP